MFVHDRVIFTQVVIRYGMSHTVCDSICIEAIAMGGYTDDKSNDEIGKQTLFMEFHKFTENIPHLIDFYKNWMQDTAKNGFGYHSFRMNCFKVQKLSISSYHNLNGPTNIKAKDLKACACVPS